VGFERKKGSRIYTVASSGGQETDKRVGLFGRSTVGNRRNERVLPRSELGTGTQGHDMAATRAASAFALRTTRMPVKYISRDVRQQFRYIIIFRSSDPFLSL
jgi:hypothetical protein